MDKDVKMDVLSTTATAETAVAKPDEISIKISFPDVFTLDHWQTYSNGRAEYVDGCKKNNANPDNLLARYFGALALIKAARIAAGLRGADFVAPDDVKDVAVWVMAHRLLLAPEAALEGASDVEVVRGLLTDTAVPR